jgi:hypothetical protein
MLLLTQGTSKLRSSFALQMTSSLQFPVIAFSLRREQADQEAYQAAANGSAMTRSLTGARVEVNAMNRSGGHDAANNMVMHARHHVCAVCQHEHRYSSFSAPQVPLWAMQGYRAIPQLDAARPVGSLALGANINDTV